MTAASPPPPRSYGKLAKRGLVCALAEKPQSPWVQ